MLENGCGDLFPFRHTSGSEVKALMFDDGVLMAVPIARCLLFSGVQVWTLCWPVKFFHIRFSFLLNHPPQGAALCCLQRSDIWPHLLACVLSFCTCRTPSASVRGENTNPWSVFHLLVVWEAVSDVFPTFEPCWLLWSLNSALHHALVCVAARVYFKVAYPHYWDLESVLVFHSSALISLSMFCALTACWCNSSDIMADFID